MRFPFACAICSRWIQRPALCFFCRRRLFRLQEPVYRRRDPLLIRSLFAWRPLSPEALERLISALKGKADGDWWRDPALWSLQRHPWPRGENRAVVPVPSEGPNHALGFARALAECANWTVQDTLCTVGPRLQKKLNREARQSIRFELKAPFSCTRYTSVLIVDDIVTTGATSVAAHAALGHPKKAEVWCLADRRPCGELSPEL